MLRHATQGSRSRCQGALIEWQRLCAGSFLFACLSLLALALALTGTALAGNGGIAPPAETPQADRIQDLHWLLLGITGVIFLLVEGALIAFVIRFRNAAGRDLEGSQIRGHTRIELIWTGIPVVILAVIFGVVFYKLPGIKDIADATAGGDRKTIQRRAPPVLLALHVSERRRREQAASARRPARRAEMSMPAKDVVHSWWIPAVGGKTDAIPGRLNSPARHQTGNRRIQGPVRRALRSLPRANARAGSVVKKTRTMPDYTAWTTTTAKKQLGKMEWEGVCAKCHGMEGQGD